jgi:hypothetical protein
MEVVLISSDVTEEQVVVQTWSEELKIVLLLTGSESV